MRPPIRFATALLLALLLAGLTQAPAWAQVPAQIQTAGSGQLPPPGQPVMQNVFFNVVWGSALGATLGVASAVLASSNKAAPNDVRQGAFNGATAGGLIGLGLALYFVYNGITLDPAGAVIHFAQRDPPSGPAVAQAELPPFSLVTAPGNPHRITGFSARVINLRF